MSELEIAILGEQKSRKSNGLYGGGTQIEANLMAIDKNKDLYKH